MYVPIYCSYVLCAYIGITSQYVEKFTFSKAILCSSDEPQCMAHKHTALFILKLRKQAVNHS